MNYRFECDVTCLYTQTGVPDLDTFHPNDTSK